MKINCYQFKCKHTRDETSDTLVTSKPPSKTFTTRRVESCATVWESLFYVSAIIIRELERKTFQLITRRSRVKTWMPKIHSREKEEKFFLLWKKEEKKRKKINSRLFAWCDKACEIFQITLMVDEKESKWDGVGCKENYNDDDDVEDVWPKSNVWGLKDCFYGVKNI